MGAGLRKLVESAVFRGLVAFVVMANAFALGLETYRDLPEGLDRIIAIADGVFIAFFVLEMVLKITAWRAAFFRSSWNVFDLLVVAVSIAPAAGPFSVLRVFRILRMLRVVSVIPPLRRVVEALIRAVPGIAAILGVMAVFFYIGGVLATSLYGQAHPELFGMLGRAVLTLFQLMLFDGWAEVVHEVGATHPWSVVFFIIFTVLTGFAVLNLFIAVMVDALRAEHDRLQDTEIDRLEVGQVEAARELDEVETAVNQLERKIDRLIEIVGDERR